jgi:group I intron endonuclease
MSSNLRRYCIYLHRNRINGLVYVGQTCQKPEDRWRKGAGYKGNTFFFRDINNYGWDNFDHIILEENLTKEMADERESYYIKLYDSTNPLNGYNIRSSNASGYHFADLWNNPIEKEKIVSKLKEQRNTPEYKEAQGKMMASKWQTEEYRQAQKASWTQERREKTSQRNKELWKNSEYRKKCMPDPQKVRDLWQDPEYRKRRCKAVQCINTVEVFDSLAAASRWCGTSANALCTHLKKGSGTSGQHPETGERLSWRYYVEDRKEG